MILSRRARGR